MRLSRRWIHDVGMHAAYVIWEIEIVGRIASKELVPSSNSQL